jgi:hypothetical protein
MKLEEKVLYHQIHPLKLFTDISTAAIALSLLWKRRIAAALLVMWVPSICVSWALIRFVDLERYKRSRFGAYVRRSMTRSMEALRFAGLAVMAIGAWFHRVWLIPLGVLIVLGGWLRGLLLSQAK